MSATARDIRILALICCLGLGHSATARATEIVLYDGSLGTLPTVQGWTYFGSPIPTVSGNATNLDSSANEGDQAGFFRFGPAPLDASLGYSLNFDVELKSETHTGNANRAGFSVLMTGADPTQSIELGFQDGGVFSQNDGANLFGTPAESTSFNPVGMGLVQYSLSVFGSAYELTAGGTSILSGSLRNYTPFGFPPYIFSNFLFLGDNTTSAGANVDIARVSFVVGRPVPLPATLYVFCLGLAALGINRRRSTRS